MQRTRIMTWLTCAISLLIGLATLAPAAQQPPPEGQGGPRGRRPMSVEERLKRMSERLNLTDEQKEKIRPMLRGEADQMKALHEDQSLSPEQRREKGRQIRRATDKQIRETLTPEQRGKMRENARARRQEGQQAPPQ
jgi:Spy/CpxP family protein refolding chaperone